MAEVSFFVNLDEHKIQHDHTRQDWIDQFRAEHDLDLGDDADWNDVYRTIAMDHLAGGEYSEYVTGQGWDVETDAGPGTGADGPTWGPWGAAGRPGN